MRVSSWFARRRGGVDRRCQSIGFVQRLDVELNPSQLLAREFVDKARLQNLLEDPLQLGLLALAEKGKPIRRNAVDLIQDEVEKLCVTRLE